MIGQQLVAVVVEIADQRHSHTHALELLADPRHRRRRLVVIDGDAHQLGPGPGKLGDLDRGADMICGVGVGHGLHHDRRIRSYRDRPTRTVRVFRRPCGCPLLTSSWLVGIDHSTLKRATVTLMCGTMSNCARCARASHIAHCRPPA